MTKDETATDRIGQYLRRMTPQTRKTLLVEIERKQMYGEDVPGADIILANLRAEFRNSGQSQDRVGNPSRYFFQPIEALFVDRSPERTNAGQISRGSLSAIWECINNDLLRTMAHEYCNQMKQVLVINDPNKARLIAAEFQHKVVKFLKSGLASASGVERLRRALANYTASHEAFDDLRKIVLALKLRDDLAALDKALPPTVKKFEGELLAKVRGLLDAFAEKHPAAAAFALTLVAKRLKTPWQLIHLATKISRGRSADELAATRYAASVGVVLDQLDDEGIALRHALKSNRVQVAKDTLTRIYDIEDALRARIERLEESDWGRRLDSVMAAIAANLEAELHSLPEGAHHVLGSRKLHRHPLKHGVSAYLKTGRDLLSNGLALGRGLVHLGDKPAG